MEKKGGSKDRRVVVQYAIMNVAVLSEVKTSKSLVATFSL
jgi:hypothetical protein